MTFARRAVLALIAALSLPAAPAHAVLMDHGDNGEYFFDTESGLYWWDPATFVDDSKTEIDAFVAANADWKYASYVELLALIGQMSDAGQPLDEVMGPAQLLLGPPSNRAFRWVGYYDGICPVGPCAVPDPDGWNVQTVFDTTVFPFTLDSSTIGSSGLQGQVETRPARGAWINSAVDPFPTVDEPADVGEPATLALLGVGLLGFAARRRRG
jgi:hypothetical protein